MNVLLWAMLATALAIQATPHAARAMSSPTVDNGQLDRIFARWLGDGAKRRAPALSVAIGLNGRLLFARGYGEARPGQPATEHTVYHIGSLSKQFTAAAILMLIERGATVLRSLSPITLASPVSDLLAGFDNPTHATLTVRGLLTMTSGLPSLLDQPPQELDPWGAVPATLLVEQLRRLPASAPGTFAYNNSAYLLLAQVVEATADGQQAGDFSGFVSTSILTPANLKDTGFIGDNRTYRSLSVAVPSWGSTPLYLRRPAFVNPDWLKGAAEMASSAADLFAWNKALMEEKVIDAGSRETMFAESARVGISRYYGMGWFIEHEGDWDRYSHMGYVPGFTASNMIVRNVRTGTWISVSLLTNADAVHGLDDLASDIARKVMRRLGMSAALH